MTTTHQDVPPPSLVMFVILVICVRSAAKQVSRSQEGQYGGGGVQQVSNVTCLVGEVCEMECSMFQYNQCSITFLGVVLDLGSMLLSRSRGILCIVLGSIVTHTGLSGVVIF